MTDKLLELAERCEKATGPDRELDCEIAVAALGFFVAEPRYKGDVRYCYKDSEGVTHQPGNAGDMLARAFTASLDAALTLVPEGWHISFMSQDRYTQRSMLALARNGDNSGKIAPCEDAATPALALTAAALKARSQQQ